MKKQRLYNLLQAVVISFCLTLGSVGCEGTDTREAVDDTVEEMAGKKNLERYQQTRKDLDAIDARTTRRYDQLKSDPNDD